MMWFFFLVMVFAVFLSLRAPVRDVKPAIMMAVLCLIGFAMSGCSLLPDGAGTEIKHDSVLLKGRPFTAQRDAQGLKVEDTLDVWNNYLWWQRDRFYSEVGIAVKLREGGFYDSGSPFIFNARAGYRFRFGQ